MVAIFARADEARVLIERKSDLRLMRQAGAFQDDLRAELGHRVTEAGSA